MQSIEFIYLHNPVIFYFFIASIGLCIGSFLNVVIYRLPIMLNRQWQTDCHEYLQLPIAQTNYVKDKLSLSTPHSHCPNCKSRLAFLHNIPIISYCFLLGRCGFCQQKISIRYPLIEALTALLTVYCFLHYGFTLQAVFATILCWTLISLTLIDFDHHLLPDNLTLSLVWLGMLVNLTGTFTDSTSAILGAVFGYGFLWSFMKLYQLLTGKQGMGHGDFKLTAALGAWLGWQQLPLIIILSAFTGAILGSLYLLLKSKNAQTAIPFGPYLAIAGIISLFWGDIILQQYMQLMSYTY